MVGINPQRLCEIRVMRKMKLVQLAEALGVTKQAVSKYEHGKSIPSPHTIEKMLDVLKIPRKYLLKKSVEIKSCSPLFFRALSSTTKGHMEYANVASSWGYEIICEINKQFQEYTDFQMKDNLTIPEKAMEVRRQLGAGTLPIKNLTDLLEKHGIYIFVIDSAELNTDAYSRTINGVPIIVLNKHKGTSVRWRFSLAHELGHLVLHKNLSVEEFSDRNQEIEQEANLFAEYFLMPSNAFENSIISLQLEELVRLKKEWGVSIAAIVYHCGRLGLIDSSKLKSLQVKIGGLGWKKVEPLDDELEFEMPQKMKRLISNQFVDNNSFTEFHDKVRLPLDEIERICSIPEGFLAKYEVNEMRHQGISSDSEQLTLFDFGGDFNA